jgi:hypothetical protein
MTIAVVWHEDGLLWCAADTRLVAGIDDKTTSEMAAKIYSIPLSISAFDPSLDPSLASFERRQPHYWTQYGFVYAGGPPFRHPRPLSPPQRSYKILRVQVTAGIRQDSRRLPNL